MAQKSKILVCAGTRADSIKMCPLYLELAQQGWADVYFCNSAQHTEMTDGVLSFFGVRADRTLSVMSAGQSPDVTVSRTAAGALEYISELMPDVMLVHGDTASALGFALAGYEAGICVCHIEAGLRSGDESCPYPEEIYRKRISAYSSYHFAPTERAEKNLLSEGVSESRIFTVGNTVIDALKTAKEREAEACAFVRGHDFEKPTVLFTLHRRENFPGGAREVFLAVKDLLCAYPELSVIFPIHKSEAVRKAFYECGVSHPRLILCEPLDYPSFVYAMRRSIFVISDSGGVCEECGFLGIPAVIARERTERTESILEGCAMLCAPKRELLYSTCGRLLSERAELEKMKRKTAAYGTGGTCARIAEHLCRILNDK